MEVVIQNHDRALLHIFRYASWNAMLTDNKAPTSRVFVVMCAAQVIRFLHRHQLRLFHGGSRYGEERDESVLWRCRKVAREVHRQSYEPSPERHCSRDTYVRRTCYEAVLAMLWSTHLRLH